MRTCMHSCAVVIADGVQMGSKSVIKEPTPGATWQGDAREDVREKAELQEHKKKPPEKRLGALQSLNERRAAGMLVSFCIIVDAIEDSTHRCIIDANRMHNEREKARRPRTLTHAFINQRTHMKSHTCVNCLQESSAVARTSHERH